MRYFRTYPWGMQLMLFLLMSFTFMAGIGAITLSVFTKMTGFAVSQLSGITPQSPTALIHAFVTLQGLQNLFVFLVPAAVFAYLSTPRPAEYLGLRKPASPMHLLLSILLMAGAMPLLLLIQTAMQQFNFGADVKTAHEAQMKMNEAIMMMPTFGDFLRTFVVMSIIPGIGEELFFRGVMMRFVKKKSRGMLVPMLFTAAVFSYSHANVYGYLSIFLAGSLLAGLYYFTGSIWCSIAGHIFFNGFQVVLSYMGRSNATIKAFVDSDTVPVYYAIGGAVVFVAAALLLAKTRTPLKPGWTDDYTPAELAAMQSEGGGPL